MFENDHHHKCVVHNTCMCCYLWYYSAFLSSASLQVSAAEANKDLACVLPVCMSFRCLNVRAVGFLNHHIKALSVTQMGEDTDP